MGKPKKIGLALGGGAALGAAHLGVLKAIKELDIEISYITGTSIGAFVAAFYAFGGDLREIEEKAVKLDWLDVTNITLSRYALLSNKKMGQLIVDYIGSKNIEESDIPLAIIATDVSSGNKIVLDKGPVDSAVMASCCVPGIFEPVERDGMMLVDGGIVENVPSNTVRELGAEFTIGVDLNATQTYGKPDSILDVILHSFHFSIQESVKLQTQDASLLIQPDLSAFSRSDISHAKELMEKGYEDAKALLEDL